MLPLGSIEAEDPDISSDELSLGLLKDIDTEVGVLEFMLSGCMSYIFLHLSFILM